MGKLLIGQIKQERCGVAFFCGTLIICLCLMQPNGLKAEEAVRRGLFVSVIQNPPVLSSREQMTALVQFAKQARIQILFVQLYRSNRAWFASQVGDSRPYQTALDQTGKDPVRFLIREAHAAGIQVHAWLNLLSLGANEDAPLLQKYGPGILTKNLSDKGQLSDYKIDSQYFLEPGDLRVRDELSAMTGEVVGAYPELDGVQFDYIRYPDKNPHYGFTPMNVERFKKETGISVIEEKSAAWQNWKRDQVTELLEILIRKARSIRPDIQVSTTGCTGYVRAHDEAFQDWPSWVDRGLVDFVTIMSYRKNVSEFEKDIADARKRVNDFRKINIGIGAYELTQSPESFAGQLGLCERASGGMCVIFHYGSLLENASLTSSL